MMTKTLPPKYVFRFGYVLELLDQHKGRHREISRKTGIKYTTLSKIAQRLTKNPGVLTIEKIADFFEDAA